IVLILLLDLRDAIAISGVAVLLYYAITNGAALTLTPSQRRFPRAFAVVGLAGCIVLIGALPVHALVGGGGVILCGIGARHTARRLRNRTAE
ncbi:MAG: amino acid permease, partial [Acidimicrobiales bacterium]